MGNRIKKWNKIGLLKSILILIISLLSLNIFNFNENAELRNDFYLGISVFALFFIHLFLPLVTKLWSLFGVEFKKPNWNENPLSLNFSNSLILFQFLGYWFISAGLTKIIFIGIFFQKFHGESFLLFVSGISVISGIKLSLKWLNKKGKTLKNDV